VNSVSIGKKIRYYRETKKWTQEDFAEKAGLSLTYVGMIERGEKVPKLETFINIANVLGVSADILLADVLKNGYQIKTSLLSEKIDKLTAEQRDKIYAVIEAMLK
jgi:transcriptional regulator with XRE-family HTH domain